MTLDATADKSFRSGFACFVGRPNVGKSTLMNALVGAKVAITSSRPQTTRHAVRGIVNRPAAQLILVDTPGLHRPRTLLGARLNDIVKTTWAEVDVVSVCLAATDPVGPGDRFLVSELAKVVRTPKLAVVTKTDLVTPDQLATYLMSVAALGEQTGVGWEEIVPVSAVDGFHVGLVGDLLTSRLPEGPALYLDGELTDEPETTLVAELVREAALEGVRDELPHSLAVVVEEMAAREGRDLIDIQAVMFVERDSQKAIVIGNKGERLREIGTKSRLQMERLFGRKVFLETWVRVREGWSNDEGALRTLGYHD